MRHLLPKYGGLFLFNCNFDFASSKDWNSIIWNNKEIRVNGSPVYYKNYFDSDIFYVSDLLFNLIISACSLKCNVNKQYCNVKWIVSDSAVLY